MPLALPKNIVDEVFQALGRAGFGEERALTPATRAEGATVPFSNWTVLQFADMGAVHVAARSKASRLQDLTSEESPPFMLIGMLRLLGTTPEIGGTKARRRTRMELEYDRKRGAGPNADAPTWTFDGGDLRIEGDSVNPAGARATFIQTPLTNRSDDDNTGSGYSLSGTTLSFGGLEEKHEETILYLIDAGDEYPARVTSTSGSSAEVDTEAPDASYEVVYFDHACAQIDRRLRGAVAELATSLCFASLANQDALEATTNAFGREMQGSMLPTFSLRGSE